MSVAKCNSWKKSSSPNQRFFDNDPISEESFDLIDQLITVGLRNGDPMYTIIGKIKRGMILGALLRFDWHLEKTCLALGMSRATLRYFRRRLSDR